MRETARQRVLETLPDDALVLDVGGWAVPFPRADWMLDLAPYETRGEWGYEGERSDERFTAETWVQRDICDREPWPFADKQFDFAICSHTLEDVRDPVWVCSELIRVARAGYIEVPSRLVEQAWGVHGPWAGWSHHHWLVDIDAEHASIEFVFKHHIVHRPGPNRFRGGFDKTLTEDQQVQSMWWQDRFDYRERIFLEPAELDAYLESFVRANGPPDQETRPAPPSRVRRLLRR